MRASLPMPVLRPGMCIQVVAPSSPFPLDDFERGVARLRRRYEVRYETSIGDRTGYLAGTDDRRARELQRAIEDDSVHAIVAARGGYGATRLLPALPVASVTRNPKPLIGFSDITALHAVWARAGLGSIHGSMVAALGRCPEELLQRWIASVEGAPLEPIAGLRVIGSGDGSRSPASGRAQGVLLGGNLTVLTALIGTPYAPPLTGCVLFLEDHGERPYRVDRMLTSWRHAGWLERPSAIVLGAFTDCEPRPDGTSVDDVLQTQLSELEIPVLSGLPAGHLDDNLELPLGAWVEVDIAAGTLSYLEHCTR